MSKTVRFDPSGADDDVGVTPPFNPVIGDALRDVLATGKPTAPSGDDAQSPVAAEVSETETVAEIIAAEVDPASSGDDTPLVSVEQVRPPKTHRVERGPRREAEASDGDQEVRRDRPHKEIPIEHFCSFTDDALVALISAIREGGSYPVVRLFAHAGGESSGIEFGLALLPGPRGECQRVGMTIVGGEGIFRTTFGRCKFFRDELFGYREPTPERVAPTKSLRHLLDFVLSLPTA